MGTGESSSTEIKRILSGPGAIVVGTGAAREFAKAQGLAEADRARLCLIVEELLANLYEHGGVTEVDRVELHLAAMPEGIAIDLTDPGQPFDPERQGADGPVSKRGAGAGVRLVRSWTRHIAYESAAGRNRLAILMPLAPTGS